MNLNLSPTLSMEQVKDEDHDHHYEGFKFGLNHQIFSSSSSSSSSPCRILFSSRQDHGRLIMEDYYGYDGGSAYGIENKVENGLRLGLWKKEDHEGPAESMLVKDSHVKWVPTQIEVKKVKVSCCLETDLSSSSYNCNTPIRVCSDCHTTKTPLWRSGPKGPKSLCNACGIRQRKARRAMAAAAAACGRTGVDSYQPTPAKVKEKMGKSGKKRCKPGAGSGVGSSSSSGFEDFLINLSNKLSFHRVFPQDEKEAAILLMALSSGLVHG